MVPPTTATKTIKKMVSNHHCNQSNGVRGSRFIFGLKKNLEIRKGKWSEITARGLNPQPATPP
jgi:hypothetical protein